MAINLASPSHHTASEPNFELNDKQYDFVYDDSHKYVAYIGGIGAGKTYAGAIKALRYMLEHPGSLGMIAAPTYPMLRDSTLRTVRDVFPSEIIADFNKHDGLLTLVNGSEALLRSMTEPDDRRGPNLAWFWLDEAPLCGYYAWKVSKGRLRQAGHPQQAWATGTPHGEDEFYEDFENFENTGEPAAHHKLYRASTRENLHNLPEGYIEDLGYTGQFALQEIEGLFVNFEGLVYELRSEWHFGEWIDKRADGNPHQPVMRIGGVDWGYTNPAAVVPVWVDADNRAYLLEEFYHSRVGLEGVSAACVDYSRRYGIQQWYCGPDEPEHIDALNMRFGREKVAARAIAANDEITAGIETVRRQMALRGDGTTGFKMSARCVSTRAEMRSYSYPTRGAGRRDPDEKPIKKMDHALDAVRYALHTALGKRGRERVVSSEQLDRLRAPDNLRTAIGGINIMRREF